MGGSLAYHLRERAPRGTVACAVTYQPPPDPYQSATPRPSAPAGQYSPDGRWYWNGEQWIAVTVPGPAWARPYAPVEGRAAAAVALVALASFGFGLVLLAHAFDLAALAAGTGSAALVAEAIAALFAILAYGAGVIGSAITVPMWMHRAFRNLPALGEQGMSWSPAWAAGGWFVPFANLVIPYLVMRELWSAFGDGRSLPQQWWAAYIGAGVVQLVGFVFTVFSHAAGDLFSMIADLALIAAGFLLIVMIRRISRRQRDRHQQLQAR